MPEDFSSFQIRSEKEEKANNEDIISQCEDLCVDVTPDVQFLEKICSENSKKKDLGERIEHYFDHLSYIKIILNVREGRYYASIKNDNKRTELEENKQIIKSCEDKQANLKNKKLVASVNDISENTATNRYYYNHIPKPGDDNKSHEEKLKSLSNIGHSTWGTLKEKLEDLAKLHDILLNEILELKGGVSDSDFWFGQPQYRQPNYIPISILNQLYHKCINDLLRSAHYNFKRLKQKKYQPEIRKELEKWNRKINATHKKIQTKDVGSYNSNSHTNENFNPENMKNALQKTLQEAKNNSAIWLNNTRETQDDKEKKEETILEHDLQNEAYTNPERKKYNQTDHKQKRQEFPENQEAEQDENPPISKDFLTSAMTSALKSIVSVITYLPRKHPKYTTIAGGLVAATAALLLLGPAGIPAMVGIAKIVCDVALGVGGVSVIASGISSLWKKCTKADIEYSRVDEVNEGDFNRASRASSISSVEEEPIFRDFGESVKSNNDGGCTIL